MTERRWLDRITQQEHLNFLLTNRIPRRWATRFMGWFSRIECPWVSIPAIAVWKAFAGLDLADAAATRYPSVHACFVRELRPGSRPINADMGVLASPCDAIVGASGKVQRGAVLQAKGFPYTVAELLQDQSLATTFADGCYTTLRLTSAMYHHFHAPHGCRIDQLIYVAGDTWNVNPVALNRVDRLYCRNERAVLAGELTHAGQPFALVAVAAILVAGIRLNFVEIPAHVRVAGPYRIACAATFAKGEEIGWFEHGSTIIVFAPAGFDLSPGIVSGAHVRMGEALMVARGSPS